LLQTEGSKLGCDRELWLESGFDILHLLRLLGRDRKGDGSEMRVFLGVEDPEDDSARKTSVQWVQQTCDFLCPVGAPLAVRAKYVPLYAPKKNVTVLVIKGTTPGILGTVSH